MPRAIKKYQDSGEITEKLKQDIELTQAQRNLIIIMIL